VAVARAVFDKAWFLQAESDAESLARWEDFINRFGGDHSTDIAELVIRARVNRLAILRSLGDNDAVVGAADELLVSRPPGVGDDTWREGLTQIRYNKAQALTADERLDEALHIYDEILASEGGDDLPALYATVLVSRVNRSYLLMRLERSEEAIAVADDVIARYGADSSDVGREAIARATLYRAWSLLDLAREDDARQAFEEIVARFGEDAVANVRAQAERAREQLAALVPG
jgi:tetratricopeptide (TPR) repeat protein